MRLAQMISPLRHPPFRRQFLAQAISLTGSSLTPVAVAFGVLKATGSASALGLVLAAYTVPNLVLMVVGGVWADRLPRQRLIVVSNLFRFATQTSFGVLLLVGHHPLWAMMALQAIGGSAQAFAAPAGLGLTAATAPADARQQANALLAVTGDVTGIVGPLLAGVLTATIGAGWALVIDGISFLGSAYFLSGLRLPALERQPTHFFTELRDGWREVSKRSWVWASIIHFAVFNLVFSVFVVLGPARLAGTSGGALSWGAIMAGMSVGTLCGNALALRLTPRYLLRWPRLLELVFVLPTILALAFGAPAVVLVGCALVMGISMSYPDALWFTALQQEIPEAAISRVSSFDFLGSFALRPIGYALAAAMVSFGAKPSLLIIAGVFSAGSLLTMIPDGVRNLTRRPPEPVAEDSIEARPVTAPALTAGAGPPASAD